MSSRVVAEPDTYVSLHAYIVYSADVHSKGKVWIQKKSIYEKSRNLKKIVEIVEI